ncbi:MAG: DinB family protein [Anaerolineaceae bacterium]|nr:DinB family protein [Anaerolineaceae bacterium]
MAADDVTEAGIANLLELAVITPKRLTELSASLDEKQCSQPLQPDEWSILQILNHLRACQEVWTHSISGMLAFDTPSLKEIHPRQWIKQTSPYTSLSFADGLRQFTLRREALLITLNSLSIADWQREARIDRQVRTVYTHVQRLVNHEQAHCDQIEAALTSK